MEAFCNKGKAFFLTVQIHRFFENRIVLVVCVRVAFLMGSLLCLREFALVLATFTLMCAKLAVKFVKEKYEFEHCVRRP